MWPSYLVRKLTAASKIRLFYGWKLEMRKIDISAAVMSQLTPGTSVTPNTQLITIPIR